VLRRFAAAAQAALDAGLGVNAGHDLNRDNLTDFLRAVPGVQEVSIGHALISDALELGYDRHHQSDYLRCIDEAFAALPRVAMIYGIGTDICDIRRMRATLERHGDRFAEKVLGDAELQRSMEGPQRAMARARPLPGHPLFGQGGFQQGHRHGHAHAHDLARCARSNLPSGASPLHRLHGGLKTGLMPRGLRAHVTVTDETDYAASFVVVETAPPA
jgi:holo-[acyl-carrier protein] synthase